MFPFLKKNKTGEKAKKQGNDSTVDAASLLGDDSSVEGSNDELVSTELSMHPDTKASEQQYVFAFLNNELPQLKPNQLSLSGIEMNQKGDQFTFTVFIRQTLSNAIGLKETPILLIGPNDEKLGRKVFDLSPAGKIPARSSRPWTFTFSKDDLFTEDIPEEGWKLAFELRPSARQNVLDLAESWKKSLAEKDIAKLEEIVKNAKTLKPGEINFMNLEAKFNDKGDLAVTLLLRNGGGKNLFISNLPLQVEDATGEIIARGGFALEKLEVKSGTSKPWTFVFPKDLLLTENPDLSKWKAYPIKK